MATFGWKKRGSIPIRVVIDGQVGCQQEEFLVIVRAQQKRVAHAFLAQFAHQDRLSAVQRLPVAAIAAQAEINLLGQRRLLAFEGDEQESAALQVELNFESSCLHANDAKRVRRNRVGKRFPHRNTGRLRHDVERLGEAVDSGGSARQHSAARHRLD